MTFKIQNNFVYDQTGTYLGRLNYNDGALNVKTIVEVWKPTGEHLSPKGCCEKYVIHRITDRFFVAPSALTDVGESGYATIAAAVSAIVNFSFGKE